MVGFFSNSANLPNKMTLTLIIRFPAIFSDGERLETGKFHRSVPNGKRGLHVEVVYNFRMDFRIYWLSRKHLTNSV